MSAYLLMGDYRDRGDVRLLVMACAYWWSLTVMAGYALAFPGVVSPHPPLALVPSLAAYFYVAWHSGFPIFLGAAWAPWPSRWTKPTPLERRGVVAMVVTGVTAASGIAGGGPGCPVPSPACDHQRLGHLTDDHPDRAVCTSAGPGCPCSFWGTQARTGPERWSSVAVLVCLLDLLLTSTSKTRYNMGWYTDRSLTLLSAGVVLVAMLATFRRHKAEAEHNASERSRLRSRLREMSATDMAHAAGGLGAWARYRGNAPAGLVRVGFSVADPGELGIVPGQGWLTFVQTDDLDRFEMDEDVVLDEDGNVGVVERSTIDGRVARVLVDTYLWGDARQSAAATAELERRAA